MDNTNQQAVTDAEIVEKLAEHGIGLIDFTSGVEPFPLDGEDAPLFIAAFRDLLAKAQQPVAWLTKRDVDLLVEMAQHLSEVKHWAAQDSSRELASLAKRLLSAPAAQQPSETVIHKLLQEAHDEIVYLHKTVMQRNGIESDGLSNSTAVAIRSLMRPAAQEAAREQPADEQAKARNWTEDTAHENGNYECQCVHCGQTFRGHKRRVCCKACAGVEQQAPSTAAQEQTDAFDRVREALPEFQQQDDYLLAHGASLMSEDSHEIIHVETVRKIIDAALAHKGAQGEKA